MAVSDVKKIYQDVINDVCSAVREALSQEGYDDHTLQELRTVWLAKLDTSKAVESIQRSAVDEATTRNNRRTTTGETNNSLLSNNRQSTGGLRPNNLHPASATALSNFTTSYAQPTTIHTGTLPMGNASATTTPIRPTLYSRPQNQTNMGSTTMKTSNQLDGANDDIVSDDSNKKKNCRKKKSKMIHISFQLDGTGPPVAEDDDDEDDSEPEGNEVGEELDDDDDEEGNEEGQEDPNPLCSDDDVSDDEPAELFDTDNVVVCQYDKISRTKNKWRFILKSGVMNIGGKDYVFSKATGDADW